MMIATAFLSMWVSNTATTLMMLPIALSVLTLVIENTKVTSAASAENQGDRLADGQRISDVVEDPEVRVFGVALLLSVAWAASIGGLGTLLGSPPNAIAQWMMLGLPIVVVFLAVAWLLITRVLYRFNLDSIPGGSELIDDQIDELGPMGQGEKVVLAVFSLAAFFWIVPGVLSNIGDLGERFTWLGGFDDTVIAITAGVAMFLIPGDKEGRMTLQ